MQTENNGCYFENPVERVTVLPDLSQRKRRTIGFSRSSVLYYHILFADCPIGMFPETS
ncbi:hypothetical protein [Faecalispora jeddahensis]|uniref:hypothetical protein n=1 Tax=Faecalispora jeddahensis TaxID=1414721 RepID=UPI001896B512|nr:hypothetical protein [Faecalispora jeddahensis]